MGRTVGGGARSRVRGLAARRARLLAVVLVAVMVALAIVPQAFAGRAATGELAFYPCTDCHPVTLGADGKPTKPLPNGKKQHEIELVAHGILGKGDAACLACHDDPARNPGKLKLPDGTLVDIKGDVSRVCQRCHFQKYQEFKAGTHGRDKDKCSAQGCHSPHTPQWIYVPALPPFQGTGFEVKAVGNTREAFTPFAAPPVAPAVYTPTWLIVATVMGLIVIAVLVGYLVFGRRAQ